jgi:hypothetical protein
VRDAETGEQLGYVMVRDSLSGQGTLTNPYGFFSLSVPAEQQTLRFYSPGYKPKVLHLAVQQDSTLSLSLQVSALVDTVRIREVRPYSSQDVHSSAIVIPIQQLKRMPGLGGESDALKAMQLLPGVQFGVEGTAGLYVRGGSPDQNLILLDEMPVYNVNHLFGFFSLFHPDALKSAELIRGAFPARYGGRLSSVINLHSREGNREGFAGSAALGLVSGRASVEGPLLGGKASYFVAGRRTWIDALSRPILRLVYDRQGIEGTAGYHFYDVIGKLNYRINERDQVFVSYYGGNDQAALRIAQDVGIDSVRLRNTNQLRWGNHTVSLRLNRIRSPKRFEKWLLGFTQYRFRSESRFEQEFLRTSSDGYELSVGHYSRIQDVIARYHTDFQANSGLMLSAGAEVSGKWFLPDITVFQVEEQQSVTDTAVQNRYMSATGTLYGEADWRVSERLRIYGGLRAELFQADGWWKPSLQPRLSLRYSFSDRSSFKLAGSYVYQYLHLLTNTGVGLPTDLWVPATAQIRPSRSWQGVAGLYHDLGTQVTLALEGYYKDMQGVIEYQDGASFYNAFDTWENKVTVGRGESYGAELFAHKTSGRWQGWMSYTLSWANRQFPEIDQGQPFPYRYDRRHNFSINASCQLTPQRSLAATWVYLSGSRASVPTYRYDTPGQEFQESYLSLFQNRFIDLGSFATQLDQRNRFQLRPYHKLDVSYRSTKEKKRWTRTWVWGIYNVYGRFNPAAITIEQEPIYFSTPGQTSKSVRYASRVREYAYFRFLPYFEWEIRF